MHIYLMFHSNSSFVFLLLILLQKKKKKIYIRVPSLKYISPWGGRCTLHNLDVAPEIQASERAQSAQIRQTGNKHT